VPNCPAWSSVNLVVQIVRYEDNHNPGWVAWEFQDAEGRLYTIVEKVPMFANKHLDATSVYPLPAVVRCEVVNRWQDKGGKEFVQISIAKPDSVESTEGLSEFVVLPSQLPMDQTKSSS